MNVAKLNVFYQTVQGVFRGGLLKDTYLFTGAASSAELHRCIFSGVYPAKLAVDRGLVGCLVMWGGYHVC